MKQKNKKLAKVYHYDLYGKRDDKYKFLDDKSVNTIEWNELEYKEPYYFFAPKDFEANDTYKKMISLKSLYTYFGSALNSERNDICVNFSKSNSEKVISDFKNLDYESLEEKYKTRDSRDWKLDYAINDIKINYDKGSHRKLSYKPFDTRWIFYTGKSRGFIGTPSIGSMRHMLEVNLALIVSKQSQKDDFKHVFTSTYLIDRSLTGNAGAFGAGYVFPLYLYPEAGEQATLDQSSELTTPSFGHPSRGEELGRKPNFDMKLVGEIAKGLGLEFRDVAPWDSTTPSFGHPSKGGECREKESEDSPPVGGVGCEASRGGSNEYFTPIDLLDYIYAVLHSPTYREKYKEFLKIDFPRVPYPKDKKKFWALVDLGSQIRQLHLLETADKYITSYPNDGSNIVERKMTKNSIGYEQTGDGIGRVWINDEQYFDGVPEVAWEFYIGGYQPAQKWLKDRVGRELNFEDINHYQKIIVALKETDRLMKEIDSIGVE